MAASRVLLDAPEPFCQLNCVLTSRCCARTECRAVFGLRWIKRATWPSCSNATQAVQAAPADNPHATPPAPQAACLSRTCAARSSPIRWTSPAAAAASSAEARRNMCTCTQRWLLHGCTQRLPLMVHPPVADGGRWSGRQNERMPKKRPCPPADCVSTHPGSAFRTCGCLHIPCALRPHTAPLQTQSVLYYAVAFLQRMRYYGRWFPAAARRACSPAHSSYTPAHAAAVVRSQGPRTLNSCHE